MYRRYHTYIVNVQRISQDRYIYIYVHIVTCYFCDPNILCMFYYLLLYYPIKISYHPICTPYINFISISMVSLYLGLDLF